MLRQVLFNDVKAQIYLIVKLNNKDIHTTKQIFSVSKTNSFNF